jgi:hypothetical protein
MDIETRMQANELLVASTIAALNATNPTHAQAIRHALELVSETLADGYPKPARAVSREAVRLARSTVDGLIEPPE